MKTLDTLETSRRSPEPLDRAAQGEASLANSGNGEFADSPTSPAAQASTELAHERAHELAERIRRNRAQHPLGGGIPTREMIEEGRR